MNFEHSFTLSAMMNDAEAQFGELDSRLNEIETRLESRMNGKTRSSLIGAFFGTIFFLVAYFVLFYLLRYTPYIYYGAITVVVSSLLIIAMVVDEFLQLNYYGSFLSYKGSLAQLKRRVELGRSSLQANYDTFMSCRPSKWSYSLNAGNSIYHEAKKIENSIAGVESISGGFLHSAKNALFYIVALAWTVLGSLALFDTAYEVIGDIDEGWLIGATIVACVGEIIIAKMVWSKTNCEVNNITLFMTLTGPILFVAVIAIAGLAVGLVMLFVYIIGICIAIGVFVSSVSGG